MSAWIVNRLLCFTHVLPAPHSSKKEVLSRLHFSPVPVFALGNWIPNVLYYWTCMGHNCGLSQAAFTSEGKKTRPLSTLLSRNESGCTDSASKWKEWVWSVYMVGPPLRFLGTFSHISLSLTQSFTMIISSCLTQDGTCLSSSRDWTPGTTGSWHAGVRGHISWWMRGTDVILPCLWQELWPGCQRAAAPSSLRSVASVGSYRSVMMMLEMSR